MYKLTPFSMNVNLIFVKKTFSTIHPNKSIVFYAKITKASMADAFFVKYY